MLVNPMLFGVGVSCSMYIYVHDIRISFAEGSKHAQMIINTRVRLEEKKPLLPKN